MKELLYANQDAWKNANTTERDNIFKSYAEQLKLNIDQYKTDIASNRVKNKIDFDMALGRKHGVAATPTFYINGKNTEMDSSGSIESSVKEALKKAGISYSEGLVFESKYTYEDGYALAERLISSNATAAVVTGDELAAGVLNGLADKGVSVPEEFEIITSDDSQISRFTRPNLTTIAQPLYDLGAISMRMLTKIMHKEELEEREVLLPHGLTERRSTRKRK